MHKSLNEVLVTLPDDTKVYVSTDVLSYPADR